MGKVVAEISLSLDGYVAGPNPTLEKPLGEGGDQLHEWAFRLKSWREPHGLSGGETGPDDELVAENLRANGAVVMGRRMFSGATGLGTTTQTPTAGGETSRHFTCPCSSSPITPACRPSGAEPPP